MKVKKIDSIAFGLSFVINLIIVFLLPDLKIEEVLNRKLKVGLVSVESNKRKATTTQKTQTDKRVSKIVPEKNDVQEKPKKEIAKNEPAPKAEEKKVISLDSLAQTISAPGINVLATDVSSFRKQSASTKPDNVKKEITVKKQETGSSHDIKPSLDDLENNAPKFAMEENKDFEMKANGKESLEFDKIYDVSGTDDGLPSGYKLGVEDGDIIAKWDGANEEPRYPETAQLRGMQGTVKLKMTIDERGNVTALNLEKGSGVPEINIAIEEIARTWKIYLSKNGLNIKGDVILEYNFKLVGKNS